MKYTSLRKAAKTFVIELAVCLTLVTLIIYGLQDQMIYHPRPYDATTPKQAARQSCARVLSPLAYSIPGGGQTAFYAAPKAGGIPKRLWLMFGGNGGLILQYNALVEQPELADAGMLMIDYPGYGFNAGKPSGATIQAGADAAVVALAAHLGTTPDVLLARSGVFGHSLGSGAALEFAAAHPEARRIVLVAPFTSLYAMAFRVVGPIALLLHHNFDNDAVLRQLGPRDPRPVVEIFTGDQDQVIPVAMSRRLKAEYPWVAYHELPGYEHNHIATRAAGPIAQAMEAMP